MKRDLPTDKSIHAAETQLLRVEVRQMEDDPMKLKLQIQPMWSIVNNRLTQKEEVLVNEEKLEITEFGKWHISSTGFYSWRAVSKEVEFLSHRICLHPHLIKLVLEHLGSLYGEGPVILFEDSLGWDVIIEDKTLEKHVEDILYQFFSRASCCFELNEQDGSFSQRDLQSLCVTDYCDPQKYTSRFIPALFIENQLQLLPEEHVHTNTRLEYWVYTAKLRFKGTDLTYKSHHWPNVRCSATSIIKPRIPSLATGAWRPNSFRLGGDRIVTIGYIF